MVPSYISCFVNFLLSATVRPCSSTTSTFPEHPAKPVSSVIDPAGNGPRLCNEAIYSRESYMYMGSLGQAFRIAVQKVLTSYYVDGDITYVDRNHVRLTYACFWVLQLSAFSRCDCFFWQLGFFTVINLSCCFQWKNFEMYTTRE